jgi:hypothetical protein
MPESRGLHKRRDFQNDALIALTARRHGATVVTANSSDFELLPSELRIAVSYCPQAIWFESPSSRCAAEMRMISASIPSSFRKPRFCASGNVMN